MGICGSTNNNNKPNQNNSGKAEESGKQKKDTNTGKTQGGKNKTNNQYFQKKQIVENEKDIIVSNKLFIDQNTGTPLENYTMEKKLGEGSFGCVFKVLHKEMNVERAMKKIFGSGTNDANKEKEILNEIEMLRSLDHPNIVKVFEYYKTKDGFYIITEYCQKGELFDEIVSKAPFDEAAAAYIMYQLLSSVFYCHNLNIIHRDLKPENILIESVEKENPNFYNIKVIDFGTAKIFDKNNPEKKIIGSAYYIAPEVLAGKYTEKCDIWSCGVILYILLSGRPPFPGNADDEITNKIKLGKYNTKEDPWPSISSEAKDLIKHMLDLNHLSRYSAQKALGHKWFKKYKMRERFTNVGSEKLRSSVENIKRFKSENKLQQAALAFLVHNSLHLDEVKDIVKVFKNIDQNGDGRITREEMTIALGKIYNIADTEEEVEEIFKNVDNDNNGYIEYEEYIRASIDKTTLLTDNILRYTFKYFDKDNSGEITADEIAKILFQGVDKSHSQKLTNELLSQFDVDSNASIDFDEFKKMMTKLLKK